MDQNQQEISLLYDAQHERIDNYTYKINCYNTEPEQGEVRIQFINGIFAKATFPFMGNYTRKGWKILADIERMIHRIEGMQQD
jgi:hypothetical protein